MRGCRFSFCGARASGGADPRTLRHSAKLNPHNFDDETQAPLKVRTRALTGAPAAHPAALRERRGRLAQRQSASTYLKRLAEIGVLEERTAGREKLFVNPALMKLLTQKPPR